MLKENQKVVIRWHPNNKEYYTNKGYIFTKYKDEFEVKAEDVNPFSKNQMIAICDCCGKEYSVSFCNYYRSMRDSDSAVCYDCKFAKTKNTLLIRYNVDSPAKMDDFYMKSQQTTLAKYGVANVFQSLEIRQKQQETMLERYGVRFPLQSEEIKNIVRETFLEKYGSAELFGSPIIREQIKNTFLEKYGVDNPSKLPLFVEKAKQTCKEKYGGESSQSDPAVRAKSWATMKSRDGIPSSKIERDLVQMLIDLYGEENCTPLCPVDNMCYDCLLSINNILIDVEYDGWYWHKNRQHHDKLRDFYSMRHGYKVMRIISNGSLPTNKEIRAGVDYLVNSEHHLYKIILDDIDINNI